MRNVTKGAERCICNRQVGARASDGQHGGRNACRPNHTGKELKGKDMKRNDGYCVGEVPDPRDGTIRKAYLKGRQDRREKATAKRLRGADASRAVEQYLAAAR